MSLWNWKKSGWVNLTLAALLIISVITSICSFGMRTGFQVLVPNFSFHSGTYPEAGIFNFLLFCSAIFGFTCVALRYSYIKDQIQVTPTYINYVNKLSASLGIISFLGIIIIAAFSTTVLEKPSVIQSTGAYIFIGVGLLFTLLQTILTYASSRYSFMLIIRFSLAVILLFSFLSSIVFMEMSKTENSTPSNNTEAISNISMIATLAKKKNLLAACILEWISVVIYALFYLSFFQEFQTISAYVIMRPLIISPSSDFRSSSLTVNERI